jgi:hypothetical protein
VIRGQRQLLVPPRSLDADHVKLVAVLIRSIQWGLSIARANEPAVGS